MTSQVTQEVQREHEKTRRQLLASEAALLLLLRRSAREVIPAGATLSGTRGIVAGSRLVESLAAAVYQGRRGARVAGLRRLHAELLAIGAHDVASELAASQGLSMALDRNRAITAVRNVTGRLIRRLTGDESSRSVLSGEAFGFRRIAATEAADAFAHERRAAISGIRGQMVLYRFWDATLDKRTCPTCSAADGTAVPLGKPFPYGTPGSVHAMCRCVETIVPVEMLNPQRNAA